MALENLVGPDIFIDNLVRTNPALDDPVSQGDDHLRGIKNALLNTFPNITGPVELSQDEINDIATKYAPLESPAFTGIPTAPTAAPGTNTAQLATTAFVVAGQTGVGSGQTYQDVTAQRTSGTTYTNATSKAIYVLGNTATFIGTNTLTVVVAGITLFSIASATGGAIESEAFNFIVPAGATYSVTSTDPIARWVELR